MKKILFINTPTKFGRTTIRLGILTIAGYIRANGVECSIIDGDHATIMKRLFDLDLNAYIVAITSTTATYPEAIKICEEIKRQHPTVICVLGGNHVTALPIQTMQETLFDIGVIGEGELTMLDIMKWDGVINSLAEIKGIVYRAGKEIKINPPRELIQNLDILPLPAYDLLEDFDFHLSEIRSEKFVTKRCLSIMLSRGCPFSCRFCANSNTWGRRLRWFSVDYSINYIETMVKNHNLDSISFIDDELLCDKIRFKEFAEKFYPIVKKYNLKWECQARVSSINQEIVDLLRQTECNLVRFGIESGSQSIIDFLKKHTIKIEDCYRVVKLCNDNGIPCYASFIMGSPDETLDDIVETIRMVETAGFVSASVFMIIPYPGTEMWNICKDNSFFKDNLTWHDFLTYGDLVDSIIKSKHFSAKELTLIQRYIQSQVIDKLIWNKHRKKLDHKKEILKILAGDLRLTKKHVHEKIIYHIQKGMHHPKKIMPFIVRKLMNK